MVVPAGVEHTTTWAYDKFGRQVSRTLPMRQVETFTYNTDGTLATKTDFNVNTATYSYDPVYKRLVSVNYSDGSSESYTYEPVSGRRLTATNENGTTTYEYYPVTGRLFRETVPAGQSVEYQWDMNGNKKAEIRPGETLTVLAQILIEVFAKLRLYRFFAFSRDLMWNWRGIWDF